MRHVGILALLIGSLCFASGAHAETQTKLVGIAVVKGRLVDRCMTGSGPCGQVVADAFCRRIGFATATSYSESPAPKPTVMLGSGETCVPQPGSKIAKPCFALTKVMCTREVFDKVPGLPKSLPGTNG